MCQLVSILEESKVCLLYCGFLFFGKQFKSINESCRSQKALCASVSLLFKHYRYLIASSYASNS